MDQRVGRSPHPWLQQPLKQQTATGMPFGVITSDGGMEAGRETPLQETSRRPLQAPVTSRRTPAELRSFRATTTAMPTDIRSKQSGYTTSKITVTGMALLIQPVVPCGGLLSTMALLHGSSLTSTQPGRTLELFLIHGDRRHDVGVVYGPTDDLLHRLNPRTAGTNIQEWLVTPSFR